MMYAIYFFLSYLTFDIVMCLFQFVTKTLKLKQPINEGVCYNQHDIQNMHVSSVSIDFVVNHCSNAT